MNTTSQKPTIGRVVHYQQPCAYEVNGLPNQPPFITRMAHVVAVRTVDAVDYPVLRVLQDFTPDDFTIDCAPGGYMSEGVSEAPSPTSGCWNWPPRTSDTLITERDVLSASRSIAAPQTR